MSEALLNSMVPDLFWFRDRHHLDGADMRIQVTVVLGEGRSREDVVAFVNGRSMEDFEVVSSEYADKTFWFVPAARRFGIVLRHEPAPLAGEEYMTSAIALKESAQDAVQEYTSGQYLDWMGIGPTPPVVNIERVSGKGATAYNYYNNGLTDFIRFSSISARHGIDIRAPGVSVLDWGCGCGRLTRHFLSAAASGSIVKGIDIDPDNIRWCNEHLRGGAFSHVNLFPPTELEDESFDLVIANSVLSHLRLNALHAWLNEVKRLLKPSGLALLSYHGNFSSCAVASKSIDFLKKTIINGFNDDLVAHELKGFIDDDEYYRQTFMTDDFAERVFREYFTFLGKRVGVVSRYQNIAVLRK